METLVSCYPEPRTTFICLISLSIKRSVVSAYYLYPTNFEVVVIINTTVSPTRYWPYDFLPRKVNIIHVYIYICIYVCKKKIILKQRDRASIDHTGSMAFM